MPADDMQSKPTFFFSAFAEEYSAHVPLLTQHSRQHQEILDRVEQGWWRGRRDEDPLTIKIMAFVDLALKSSSAEDILIQQERRLRHGQWRMFIWIKYALGPWGKQKQPLTMVNRLRWQRRASGETAETEMVRLYSGKVGTFMLIYCWDKINCCQCDAVDKSNTEMQFVGRLPFWFSTWYQHFITQAWLIAWYFSLFIVEILSPL